MHRSPIFNQIRTHAQGAWGWCVREITWRRTARVMVVGVAIILAVATVEALGRAWLPTVESRPLTALYTRQQSPDGRKLDPIPLGTIDGGPIEYRIPLPLDAFPKHLIDAVLAIEDQRFHDHSGIDFRRVAGALAANVKAGGIAQGGSTITQQLTKNLFLSSRRTPIRKLREAAMALVLEARYSKERILEAYLNEIYLGQDRGSAIHGMGAASQYYFGKEPRHLLLSEAATLAAMISAPNRLSPRRQPVALLQRRKSRPPSTVMLVPLT